MEPFCSAKVYPNVCISSRSDWWIGDTRNVSWRRPYIFGSEAHISRPAVGGEQSTFQEVQMRRLNIAACSLMLLAAVSAPAMAQGGGMPGGMGRMDPAQMATRTSDRLMTGITLTAPQADSVKAIDARFAADMHGAMGGSDMRAKMTELRTKQQTELRAVLTPAQQTVFDKNVADMEKARANRTPRP